MTMDMTIDTCTISGDADVSKHLDKVDVLFFLRSFVKRLDTPLPPSIEKMCQIDFLGATQPVLSGQQQ